MIENKEEDHLIITLTDQNGNNVNCSVVATLEHNGRDYIALMPQENDDKGNFNILLFRYRMKDKGIQIENITADMEFDEIYGKFEQLLDNENKNDQK